MILLMVVAGVAGGDEEGHKGRSYPLSLKTSSCYFEGRRLKTNFKYVYAMFCNSISGISSFITFNIE